MREDDISFGPRARMSGVQILAVVKRANSMTATVEERPKVKVVHGYLPPLHAAQIEIELNRSRYKVVAAGRRFGKGVSGVGHQFKRASRGKKCRWIAPSYASDSYQSAWKMAKEYSEQIPGIQMHIQKREFDFSRVG